MSLLFAGHWIGLRHTFDVENTCTDGDGVSDTPTQFSRSTGCQVGRNSCPDEPGLDPIKNYMDYSDDSCVDNFTPLQIIRMQAQWEAYRANDDPPVLSVTFAPTAAPTVFDGTCPEGTTLFEVSITFDRYPQETYWKLKDTCTNEIILSGGAGGSYSQQEFKDKTIEGLDSLRICAPSSSPLKFIMGDVFKDGNCCKYGNGGYTIKYDGQVVKTDGYTQTSFQSFDRTTFGGTGCSAAPTPSPTADDSTFVGVRGDPHFAQWDGEKFDVSEKCFCPSMLSKCLPPKPAHTSNLICY